MKTFKTYIYYFIISFILLYANKINAKELAAKEDCSSDSIRVSLLTCSPHDEIYSLYGHTAIRYEDKSKGIDVAINYGVFSFSQPYFVLRFVFGITDYQIGIEEFSDFCKEYKSYGSSVTQQTLDLTGEEKNSFLTLLAENCSEENRTYRYNYFYNNCTTKARDLITSAIDGKVIYKNKIKENISFREIIRSCNGAHRWARFGNDILLGVFADKNTSRQDQQFLPANLERDFKCAYIVRNDGKTRPLVYETKELLSVKQHKRESGYITPISFSLTLMCLTILLCIAESHCRKKFIFIDAIVQVILGCIGLLLFTMIFSQHPTTSLNFQILLFNPIFIYIAFANIKSRKNYSKLKRNFFITSIFMALAIICSTIQTYAEGVTILALSLLLRYVFIYARLRQDQAKEIQ